MKFGSCLKVFALISILTSYSAQAFVLSGFKWGSPILGQGASLTWGYADEVSGCRIVGQNGDPCGSGIETDGSLLPGETSDFIFTEVSRAFDAWSDVADLAFTFTTAADPDILIGRHALDGVGNVLAHAFISFFNNPVGMNEAAISDIHFDTADTFVLDADDFTGGFFFNTLTHEIGHSLGLDHVGRIDTDSLMNPIIQRSFVGPQADDIAGIRELYGAAAVPLPAAFWLMLSGFGVFTAIRKHVAAS
jgi:hypothetical protein